MIARVIVTGLNWFASTAHAVDWDARWDKFRSPIAGTGSIGKEFLIELALSWFNFVSLFVAGVCVIAFIYGANTSQGVFMNEGSKEEGKKIMIGALVGAGWALVAWAVVHFAASWLTENVPVCSGGGGVGCP